MFDPERYWRCREVMFWVQVCPVHNYSHTGCSWLVFYYLLCTFWSYTMCMLVMLHCEFDSVLTICILESCILTNTICYKNFIISVQWLIAVSNHESIICSCSLHKQYNTIYTLRLRNSGCYCNNTICFTCVCVLLINPAKSRPDQTGTDWRENSQPQHSSANHCGR